MRLGPLMVFERREIGDPRPPEFEPLLVRYIVFRLPAIGVYVHKLCRSDYDRALHDHPWPFVSIILSGGYTEVHDRTESGAMRETWHNPGSVLLRPAEWRHRVVLPHCNPMDDHSPCIPAWTLVIVGRRQRRWGFHLPSGWCWWRKHNPDKGICEDEVLWENGSD